MSCDLLLPQRIVVGNGRRRDVGLLATGLGAHAYLVCGSRTLEKAGHLGEIQASLAEQRIACTRLATLLHEPEVVDVDRATAELLSHSPGAGSFFLAVGGGSAIDLAKAVAAMATNGAGHSIADFLEGVGKGLKLKKPPLPLVALPTTGGTGSEATRNAVISSFDPQFKKSLRADGLMPRLVLVDPELSVSAPREITAHTGMDAITQLIESYLTRRAQPATDEFCLNGLRLALSGTPMTTGIVIAVEHPDSLAAREQMATAALLSGMALANSGLGMAHGVAAALGIHCRVPHGLACAVMLPAALRVNRECCADRLEHLAEACLFPEHLPPQPADRIDAFFAHVDAVTERVGIPRRLSQIGVKAEQLPDIVTSSHGNSMSGNPRDLSDDELRHLLEEML